jgi:hypothetical protein
MARDYVGELHEVTFVDAAGPRSIDVEPVVLSVDSDTGLCTSPSRQAARNGADYAADGPLEWFELVEVLYYRRRPQGDWWFHEIGRGHVAFVDRKQGAPMAILDVPTAQRCVGNGDFICGG